MFGKKKTKVNAILDTQIEELLQKTKQFEDFANGNLKCESCGSIITTQNIGVIQPTSNGTKVIFYCDRIDCIEDFKHSNNQ
ncbi:MAG: hypothetical protein WC319_13085 [Candidatus Paceibacterota bacterium]